jgi:uncharacterized membrane protein
MRKAASSTNRKAASSGDEKIQGYMSEFSNGVFAFAITLLVLDIKLPAGTSKADLGSTLLSMWPNYLGFLISFLVIGLYWSVYIRLFREIIRTDRSLVILNLLYLLFIVVIPFSTSLISLYLSRLSVMVYAGLMAGAGYMHSLLRVHAGRRHRLVSAKHSKRSIRGGILLSLVTPVWFTVSIGIAFFSWLTAQLSWIVMIVVYSFLVHRLRYKVLL